MEENKEEDLRAAKLALARKKLRDHQEKRSVPSHKTDSSDTVPSQKKLHEADNNNIPFANTDNLNNPKLELHTKSSQNLENKQCEGNNVVDINITEMLISNKVNLEAEVKNLESKLSQIESAFTLEINCHNSTKQQLSNVQIELNNMTEKHSICMENITELEKNIKELNLKNVSLSDENNNLSEQLEFTKAILASKETENISIRNHLQHLQNELDVTKLQLQQLNNGLITSQANNVSNSYLEQIEMLQQKISGLEQQLNVIQKEKDQINSHYENYVGELNHQLKSVMSQNDELSKKVQSLCVRENSLIEQISEMEIRLQNMKLRNNETIENQATHQNTASSLDVTELKDKYTQAGKELLDIKNKYMNLQQLYAKSESKVIELQEIINSNNVHENISISKLTADMASDKLAAQRATEQNKKLKVSMQELEEAFVKMSQDKLELTEKITAEKYLNRELTIKLAEIEEQSKSMRIKLKAKDEEMIRLQATYRELEKKIDQLSTSAVQIDEGHQHTENTSERNDDLGQRKNEVEDESCVTRNDILHETTATCDKNPTIPQEDAMLKLQERFMKIMGDVADLSDEKHRLEHIILQLQNETDTICEYVALYQQQRSLLKKRDEERSAQIQLFQVECDRLKSQLEELSGILLRFAEDEELSAYFQVESRQKDMEKVRSLLLNLKSNTLVDPKKSLQLSSVYPCNCCSGNLIDV